MSLLEKHFLNYLGSDDIKYSVGHGSFYEKIAQYIFNDRHASGKVMGLAAFGQAHHVDDALTYQRSLDWSNSFKKENKNDWENSSLLSSYKDLAATIQGYFENKLIEIGYSIARKYFKHFGEHPLIYSGGCALNCSANMKLFNEKIFPNIFISPIPSDQSIGLGCSVIGAKKLNSNISLYRSWENQTSSFGPRNTSNIQDEFSDFSIRKLTSYKDVAKLLNQGEVVAWFHGRSECGARALGHRSLLADPRKKGIKDFLNNKIKFREAFRPYGASVLWDRASEYFDVPSGFQNPFMSFTCPVKSSHRDMLSEITHKDGTCRMQTVMKDQNPDFYELIKCFSKEAQAAPILLNTSLNIMGEPIVETYNDLVRFFERSVIKFMVVDGFLISSETI